jgi:hypothetical protein
MLKHALALAKRGLYVFPCLPRAKAPATAHGVKDASVDLDLIAQWWQREPKANIGIATGERSHIFVLDCDNGNVDDPAANLRRIEARPGELPPDADGERGDAALAKLEKQHGELPPTVEAITARGRHLYFEWPDKQVIRNSAGKIGPGLDIRGQNGYVLAPPSIHPSGGTYTWSVDGVNSLAPAPAWLLAKANGGDNGNGAGTATPPSEWRALVVDGVGEGARNASLARLAGHLLRKRIDAIVTLELVRCFNVTRCRPPLPDEEVERIVASICGRELKRQGHG